MQVRIYQIDSEKDTKNVEFIDLDFHEKLTGTRVPDGNIYNKVWDGSVEANSLNDIYMIFNINHPEDFTGHSLSVSDIVEVYGRGPVEKGFYYCDRSSFEKVDINIPDVIRGVVDTNYGEWPLEEYRDYRVSQYGYDSYKDFYIKGGRIGFDLDYTDKELANIFPHESLSEKIDKAKEKSDEANPERPFVKQAYEHSK